MYRKILIANRGEIACRIARTVCAMGAAVATVHSSADADALHVHEIGESVLIGEGPARQSYLDIDAVIGAARRVGADAIHPGYGFLSENAAFAQRCADEGIAFIGPSPEALALFGDKARARQLACKLGVPVAAGVDQPSDDIEELMKALSDTPLPFILKAVSGGGGKGIRVIRQRSDLRSGIESAIREGRSSFGDGRLIAEHYLEAPRHIEVQILGDGQGHVIHLLDRECTLQRRHQKVVEEAPAGSIPQALRERLWANAVALGRATSYRGLGTVEFAVTGGEAVFLEVNPRLQVEHPVTELILGLDLVALQIRAVHDGRLPIEQDSVEGSNGVAIQARLYAEDPAHNFMPSTGTITLFQAAPTARTDAGVATGSRITNHYDPMIAKVIAHGADRASALLALEDALAQTTVHGVTHNREFLMELLADEQVRRNEVTTEFIDQWLAGRTAAAPSGAQVAVLAALWLDHLRDAQASDGGSWSDARLTGWRHHRPASEQPALTHRATAASGQAWQIGFGPRRIDGVLAVRVDDDMVQVRRRGDELVEMDGVSLALRASCSAAQVEASFGRTQLALDIVPRNTEQAAAFASQHGAIRSPMMGIVIAVHAREGQRVEAGERLATLESMKMEMSITSAVAGTVKWVGCTEQGKVERHQDLFLVEP